MPNPTSLSDPANQDPPNLVNFSKYLFVSPEAEENSDFTDNFYTEAGLCDMKEDIGAMGVIASKQEPRKNTLNGSEHNNKQDDSPRDEIMVSPTREPEISEVCSRSQLEVSPKQFLRILKLKAWIERKPTTVDETSPGVLKYRTPHFRSEPSLLSSHFAARKDVATRESGYDMAAAGRGLHTLKISGFFSFLWGEATPGTTPE